MTAKPPRTGREEKGTEAEAGGGGGTQSPHPPRAGERPERPVRPGPRLGACDRRSSEPGWVEGKGERNGLMAIGGSGEA